MDENTRRINVNFPADLLEELDALVPSRKRSEVIVKATSAYLQKLKLLKETAGAWPLEGYPELATPKDVNRWLKEKRTTWRSEPS